MSEMLFDPLATPWALPYGEDVAPEVPLHGLWGLVLWCDDDEVLGDEDLDPLFF